MTNIVNVLKRLLLLVKSLIPSQVPIGVSDFQSWSTDIITLAGMPDNDSIRFALAATVLHLGPTAAFKPKLYFVLVLRAGAAKQIAGQVFQEIKQRQIDEQKAQAAATALKVVADGPTQ